jgi:folliculin
VFFGDAVRGHTLSHTFNVRDSRARGFFKLYSIIILMKDKLYLLNMYPFLSKQLQVISKEIQSYAASVFDSEQVQCSQRAQRLISGQAAAPEPRSLNELTAEKHIFAELHSHFAWLLWAGSRYFMETTTVGCVLPDSSNSTAEGGATSNDIFPTAAIKIVDREYLLKNFGAVGLEGFVDDEEDEVFNLRKCKKILRSDFVPACYCALVGIQVSRTTSNCDKKV